METNLRPLTLGEILDRTAQLYRSHFWLFAGIASVNSGAILLLGLLEIGAQEFLRAGHLTRYLLLLGGIGMAVQMFVSFIVGGVAVAANNRAVAWLYLGEPATIRGAYASILPRTGRYVWLMTIIAFIMWTPLALAYGGYSYALFAWIRPVSRAGIQHIGNSAPKAVDQGALLMLGLATILFVIVFSLAVAYAVVMGLRYSLAIAACVVENLKAQQAIRRSIELSKGSRGRIFVLGLLVAVIQIGLVLITQLFFLVMSFRQHGQLAVGARITQQLVAFATNTFLGPIYATGLTLFYYDQRVRKEGYDIEWMMQAAGLTPPSTEPGPSAETAAAEAPFPSDPAVPTAQPDHAERA